MDWNAFFESLLPMAATYALRLLAALIGLWLAFKVASLAQTRLTTALRARSFDATLSVFFGSMSRWGILVASVLAVLSTFGIETTSFAAIIGAAGLAIGLAFQGTLSNFSAGVMILVFRPFKVGDLVVAAENNGYVREIGLFATALDTKDGRRLILPNSQVANAIIENQTHNPLRRVEVVLQVGTGPTESFIREMLDAVGRRAYLRDAEKGHTVQLRRLLSNGSEWAIRVWAPSEKHDDVLERTTADVMRTLAEEKIDGPEPLISNTDLRPPVAGPAPR